ncbi:hypothetical protein [Ancylobacter lacus]|uniref:hypothetical protein n=1 Tax=Ancylobacter lacus TaxID=2579970 RepID=UPI001BCDB566|nr:hypothetical protein [Ancylobacter lacus]MBS7538023.1 hypothetical protein [Ancylobacter lacus]
MARVIAGETRLFELRAATRAGEKARLDERIAQLRQESEGLGNQIEAKGEELDLIAAELVGLRKLYRQNLVALQRVMALEREQARLKGERGQLIAATAQARGRISETGLQILQIGQDLRSDVAKDIRESLPRALMRRHGQGRQEGGGGACGRGICRAIAPGGSDPRDGRGGEGVAQFFTLPRIGRDSSVPKRRRRSPGQAVAPAATTGDATCRDRCISSASASPGRTGTTMGAGGTTKATRSTR